MTIQNKKLEKSSKWIVFSVIAITVIHTVYMNMMGFNSLSHDACIVYSSVPRWFFLLYENVLELLVVVVLGVFAGVLAEQYFNKIKRFYPSNQFLAFLYGSILPVCSCGVIPLIDSMKSKTSFRTIITFVIAAPLLNPYIIFISFTVLGFKYALIRIAASFVLAILTGQIMQLISERFKAFSWGEYGACASNSCDSVYHRDPYVKTVLWVKKLLPYILIAGILGFAIALINPKQYIENMNFSHEPITSILLTLVGIPLYVCNGTDVIFLKPFLDYTDLTLGSALAFSLSSSAICISSITMLFKFIGKRLTIALTSVIFVLIILISIITNLFINLI